MRTQRRPASPAHAQTVYDAHEAACERCRKAMSTAELCGVGSALALYAPKVKEKNRTGKQRTFDREKQRWMP